MKQYYIFEIQQLQNGEYAHLVHWEYDENPKTAQLKAESKYHTVLAAAAISDTLTHSATLLTGEGVPLAQQVYDHRESQEPII